MFYKTKKFIFLIRFSLLLVFVFFLGYVLDLEAERLVHQLYARDQQGIIVGNQSIKKVGIESHRAIILFHGFLDSPHVFQEVIEKLEKTHEIDIYAPLLPYHAKDLETASQLNNAKVLDAMQKAIEDIAKKYPCVTVVGHSYSGALLIKLAHEGKLPKNIHLVLYSPALFIKINTPINQVRNHIYGLWRNYCNYELFGCQFNPQSGDEFSQNKLYSEKNLKYRVVSAVNQLFDMDVQQREHLKQLNINFSIIIAKNDNRVSYQDIAKQCALNKLHCEMLAFEDGKHMLHYGKHQDDFINFIHQITLSNHCYSE